MIVSDVRLASVSFLRRDFAEGESSVWYQWVNPITVFAKKELEKSVPNIVHAANGLSSTLAEGQLRAIYFDVDLSGEEGNSVMRFTVSSMPLESMLLSVAFEGAYIPEISMQLICNMFVNILLGVIDKFHSLGDAYVISAESIGSLDTVCARIDEYFSIHTEVSLERLLSFVRVGSDIVAPSPSSVYETENSIPSVLALPLQMPSYVKVSSNIPKVGSTPLSIGFHSHDV